MKRINITIPKQLHDRLKKASLKTGLSVSELIRRAVDAYLSRKADK